MLNIHNIFCTLLCTYLHSTQEESVYFEELSHPYEHPLCIKMTLFPGPPCPPRTCGDGDGQGAAMIVSHDPDFLDLVCTATWQSRKKHHPIRPHSDPKERFVVHEKKDAVVNSQHFLRMLSTSHPVLRKAGMGSGCQVPTADGFVLLFFVAGKLAYYPGIFSAFKAQQLNGDEAEAKRLLETQETKEISPATQFGRAVWTGWTDGKRKIICRYSPSEYNEDDV